MKRSWTKFTGVVRRFLPSNLSSAGGARPATRFADSAGAEKECNYSRQIALGNGTLIAKAIEEIFHREL
jgi:hypothetical protein